MSGIKHDLVDKDFASPKNKKLKLHDVDHGNNHLPVPMSCDDDDPKVAKNDNSLKPNAEDNVVLFSEDEAKQRFANWCNEYGRTYFSKEEEGLRFNVFRKNLEWNTHHPDECVLNHFADWTYEETIYRFGIDSTSESDTEQGHIQEHYADKSFLSEDADYDDMM